jgi:hypothetical protein
MVSTRYVPLVILLTAAAFVPTAMHRYAGIVHDDGRRAARVTLDLPVIARETEGRTARWVRNRFESEDWLERRVVSGAGDATLFIARSYDAKRLFHHPELALWRGISLKESGDTLSTLPGVPVHVLRARERNKPGLGLYVLHYDEAFVGSPYAFELQRALALTVNPRQAMTLFFVHDDTAPAGTAIEGTLVADVLAAAVRGFLAQNRQTPE